MRCGILSNIFHVVNGYLYLKHFYLTLLNSTYHIPHNILHYLHFNHILNHQTPPLLPLGVKGHLYPLLKSLPYKTGGGEGLASTPYPLPFLYPSSPTPSFSLTPPERKRVMGEERGSGVRVGSPLLELPLGYVPLPSSSSPMVSQ